MAQYSPLRTAIFFVLLIVLVVGLSLVSNRIWGGKPEELPEIKDLMIE